jgi:hypothetical protein
LLLNKAKGRALGAAFFVVRVFLRPVSARRRHVVVQTVVPYITQLDWRGRVKVESLKLIPLLAKT